MVEKLCPPPVSKLFFFDARGLPVDDVGRGSLLRKGDVASRFGEARDGDDRAGEGLPLRRGGDQFTYDIHNEQGNEGKVTQIKP